MILGGYKAGSIREVKANVIRKQLFWISKSYSFQNLYFSNMCISELFFLTYTGVCNLDKLPGTSASSSLQWVHWVLKQKDIHFLNRFLKQWDFFSVRIIQIGSLGVLDLIVFRARVQERCRFWTVQESELSTQRHFTVLPPGGCTSALSWKQP